MRSRRAPRGGRTAAGASHWPAMTPLVDVLPPAGSDPLAVLDAFGAWAADGGRPLYAHQDEAALALAAGDHVVLATPTGSGKSLVADGRHRCSPATRAGGRCGRRRSRRWSPRSSSTSSTCSAPTQVGLATGDAAINAGAPVLVCTAEVLANHALVTGPASDFGFACLDEFHYYGDADRGLGVAGAAARADELPDAAGVGDARRHDGDHDRPGASARVGPSPR